MVEDHRAKADPTAKQSPPPLLKAVRYAALAHTPRWPAVVYARIGTDCAGLEVVMSVMEDLKIETCHVFTLVRMSCWRTQTAALLHGHASTTRRTGACTCRVSDAIQNRVSPDIRSDGHVHAM